MSEDLWFTLNSPAVLLDMVRARQQTFSTRKLRLYLCACFRQSPNLTPVGLLFELVEVVESFAEGDIDLNQLNAFRSSFWSSGNAEQAGIQGFGRCVLASHGRLWDAAKQAANLVADTHVATTFAVSGLSRARDRDVRRNVVYPQICPLLRDIFGNPFRPVAVAPEWRTSTVVALANQMYESREFGAMPILADALQDAGCDSDDILVHCRQTGDHVRGCWVVDLVLGKG
ncbi:hypothetical protein [Gemmata sp.]|uniref:hypothetical protein n=1 Tax=Gemmata sp. TaxID=1914242 RepID=UPI003F6FE2B6